jgi:hypothetical protein
MSRLTRLHAVILCATVAACSDPTAPPSGEPGFTIVAGNNAADTVRSLLPQTLIVELRDDGGRLMPGVEVRFSGVYSPDPQRASEYTTLTRRNGSAYLLPESVDTTDAAGRARMRVVLGTVGGPGLLAIRAPATGAVDTARFTVRAGNAAKLLGIVHDTTITAQQVLRLGARVTDLFLNARPDDPVTFTPTGAGLSVDAAGSVSTTVPTRGFVVVKSGGLADTARISVVPAGTFAAVYEEGGQYRLATFALDGSDRRQLATLRTNVARPSWSRGGDQLVFEDVDPPGSRVHLYLVDLQGQRRRAVASVPGLQSESMGRFSADGQWLYFDGFDGAINFSTSWRAHVDGGGAEALPVPPGLTATGQPDPSPDGAHVAISGIGVQDIAGSAVRWLDAAGFAPRYSSDGARLLFLNGYSTLCVVNADGSGLRELVTTHPYDRANPPSWSSDGQWTLIRGPNRLELVRVSTGEIIPLTYSAALLQPALKP